VNVTFLEHLARMACGGPTRMALAIGAPIAPTSQGSSQDVAGRTHASVAALVRAARAVCGP
jgi:hypothetical protein